jgi:hypothetical protein
VVIDEVVPNVDVNRDVLSGSVAVVVVDGIADVLVVFVEIDKVVELGPAVVEVELVTVSVSCVVVFTF